MDYKLSAEAKESIDKCADLENQNAATKQEQYARVMDELEIAGVPDTQIAKLGKSLIENRLWIKYYKKHNIPLQEVKINARHWYRIASKKGFTDPAFARNKKQSDDSKSPKNTSNSKITELVHEVKESCNIILAKLNSPLAAGFEKSLSEKQLKEFVSQRKLMQKTMLEVYNEKQKVAENTEQIFCSLLSTELSIELTVLAYMKYRLKKIKDDVNFLSHKQAHKYQAGGKVSGLYILQPHNRDTAIFMGCTGAKCVQCKSWKVRPSEYDKHLSVCQDCDYSFESHTIAKCPHCYILLYSETIKEIIENKSKCINPSCNKTLQFPTKMLMT